MEEMSEPHIILRMYNQFDCLGASVVSSEDGEEEWCIACFYRTSMSGTWRLDHDEDRLGLTAKEIDALHAHIHANDAPRYTAEEWQERERQQLREQHEREMRP